MSEGVLFGVIAALVLGSSDLIAAHVVRKVGVSKLLVLYFLPSLLPLVAYLILSGKQFTLQPGQLALLVGLGLLLLGTIWAFYRGLQKGSLALLSPIVAGHVALVIILAVVINGERLGPIQSVGVAAVAGGIVVASLAFGGLAGGKLSLANGALFGLIAMLGAALVIFGVGDQAKTLGWFLPLLVIRVTVAAILAGYQLSQRTWPWSGVPGSVIALAVLAGLLAVGGIAVYARGSEVAPLYIVATIFSLYVFVPIAGGLILFRERLMMHQKGGLTVALTGFVLLALAS